MEIDNEVIADALAAVAGVCDARQIPEADWPAQGRAIAALELMAGASRIEVFGALRIGDEANVPGSYVIFATDSDAAGLIGGQADALTARVRHLVRTDLGVDLGRVFMRPESLSDKISESYHHVEIDFDHSPEFSDKYYVLAEDESRLRAGVTSALLDAIGAIDGLVIEICDGVMTATFERDIDTSDAVALSRLAIVAAVR